MNGKLYIVATPIGNMDDITLRALEILKSVDFVLCEDTRVTQKILNHYKIKTKTISYHQHSTERKANEIIELLENNNDLALVTDAGTPGISDPGNKLVELAVNSSISIDIIPIPGASALTSALSVSGFPTDRFLFLGFPPHKKGRQKYFQEIADAKYTVAFYESCHRIKKALEQLSEVLDTDRQLCICRELTKKFETIYRGNITELLDIDIKDKGEFVVVINNNK